MLANFARASYSLKPNSKWCTYSADKVGILILELKGVLSALASAGSHTVVRTAGGYARILGLRSFYGRRWPLIRKCGSFLYEGSFMVLNPDKIQHVELLEHTALSA